MLENRKEKPMIEETEEITKSVEKIESASPVKKSNKYIVGIANKNGVFVRKEADGESDILYILKKDKAVIVDPNTLSDNYYRVTVESVIGYASKNEITIK